MSDKSGIEWTEATWNPTTGCTKVSAGCKNCYAKHQAWPRLCKNPRGVYTGRVFEDVQVHPERLDQPLRWTRPRRIFVNSMSDLFHEDIPIWFVDQVFAVMAMAKQHVFQVLTKRPERMQRYSRGSELFERINDAAREVTGRNDIAVLPTQRHGMVPTDWPLPNVWLGTSVENQETADERIPLLLETPAAVRWLSCEPLLWPIDLDTIENHGDLYDKATRGSYWRPLAGNFTDSPTIHWVVIGGESGPKARPFTLGWGKDIIRQCQAADVAVFMKQTGNNPVNREGERCPHITGKGHDPSEWPAEMRVREYPVEKGQELGE